jgi:sugar O-acyltransferase (sialic acid O-acetyltransferase NeuD family)
MTTRVVVFGSGRGADVAYRYLTRDSPHEVCAFTVDAGHRDREELHGLPVVPFEDIAGSHPPGEYHMFVPLGFQDMNRLRQSKYEAVKAMGYECVSYVSSDVSGLEPPEVGENCFILEGQIFNFDVTIGNNVTIWSGNHIGDRARIGDHVWISSHVCLSGGVVVEPFSIVGVNAAISHNVTIREASFIGANANVTQDTEPGGVYILPNTPKAPLTSDRFMAMVRSTH